MQACLLTQWMTLGKSLPLIVPSLSRESDTILQQGCVRPAKRDAMLGSHLWGLENERKYYFGIDFIC